MTYKRKVDRVCQACGVDQPKVYDVPDPCLGRLGGGVITACCGHGEERYCYVAFMTDKTLRGAEARIAQEKLGGRPAAFTIIDGAHGAMHGWRKKEA